MNRIVVKGSALVNRETGIPLPQVAEVERRVASANRWRDQLNPLRGLTMATAISYLEQAQRGEYADFEWAGYFIERRDADLLAIIERRVGMLQQMDWDIKTVEQRFRQRGQQFDASLAADQAAMLRGHYDGLTNLYEAIGHLELAFNRGYSHVQFIAEGKLLTTLNLVDQWNVLRAGMYGAWHWNETAQSRTAQNLDEATKLDPAAYVIRTVQRPIGEIALVKYLRQNLSAKDWDAFLEIYGVPGWIIVMPPNIPDPRRSEYESAAQAVAEGGSGALPNGSSATCADQPRGTTPFRDHLQYWSERLVLAGTGGLLTMLTAPGSGTLAGSAHWEAFQIIARSEARQISELFQRSIDRTLLNLNFPGRPCLAYFELSANEEQDVGQILDHAVKIKAAGGQPDWTEISEKTGYRITAAPAAPAFPGAPLLNREDPAAPSQIDLESARTKITATAVAEASKVRADLLAPWLAKIEALAADRSLTEAAFLDGVERLIRDLPAELLTAEAIAAMAAPLEAALGSSVFNVLAASAEGRVK